MFSAPGGSVGTPGAVLLCGKERKKLSLAELRILCYNKMNYADKVGDYAPDCVRTYSRM